MNITLREEVIPLTPHAFHILLALAEKPMYPYGITEQCQNDAAGRISFRHSTTYRTTQLLKHAGYIKDAFELPGSASAHTRRYLELTDTGRTILEWECTRLRELAFLGQHRLQRTS